MKTSNWEITNNHIYNKETITGKVYVKTFGKGKVYIRDAENYPFTCSFGANSELSFSGSFYNEKANSLEQAMFALDLFTPLHIKNKTNGKSAGYYLKFSPNGTKEDVKLNILHSVGSYYVSNEGTKQNPNYHVWEPNGTCASCDSAYGDITLAVTRCNYLALTKGK